LNPLIIPRRLSHRVGLVAKAGASVWSGLPLLYFPDNLPPAPTITYPLIRRGQAGASRAASLHAPAVYSRVWRIECQQHGADE